MSGGIVVQKFEGAGYAFIGYETLLEDADSIAATDSDASYPASNLSNWMLTSKWRAANATGTKYLTVDLEGTDAHAVDGWGIAGHNLGTVGATITPQYSLNGSDWTDLDDAVAPTGTEAIFRIVDSVNAKHVRLKIESCSDTPQVALLYFGPVLQLRGMEPGFVPPTLSREAELLNNDSEDGVLLGRSVLSVKGKCTIAMTMLDPQWVRDYWRPFMRHYERKPFLFAWDASAYPDEVAYCYTEPGRRDSRPEYEDTLYMRLSLPVIAIFE